MARPWRVKLHHIYREANYCVDLYAKEGQKVNGGVSFFTEVPNFMLQTFKDDVYGIYYPCMISV